MVGERGRGTSLSYPAASGGSRIFTGVGDFR